MKQFLTALALFFVAAFLEIGGGYLIWLWLRKKKGVTLGVLGGLVLFIYGIVPTVQPSHFGRVYAAYGGVFIVASLLWGATIDKKTVDRQEVVGAVITLVGAVVIFFAPR